MLPFFAGVIEGFYGRPWTAAQRQRLFGWMRAGGLTHYLYAPKDDVKHRTRWRLPYTVKESGELERQIRAARASRVTWVYGIGPGLDVEFTSAADAAALRARVRQLLGMGVHHFALLFDDIAPKLSARDQQAFGSPAAAQSAWTNAFWNWLREQEPTASLWFCPTPYCARMCEPSVSGSAYLQTLGELLDPTLPVFWTGPEIVSETISAASIRELARVLRRPPLLWDNLHANDYDLRRIYLGPYAGRPSALKTLTRGVLINPNCEFELNYIPIHTLAQFVHSQAGSKAYSPSEAWTHAIEAWTPEFAALPPTQISAADVRLLTDCFHLPFASGPRSQRWVKDLAALFQNPEALGGPVEARARAMGRAVQTLFESLTALTHRELLYSLYRHLWELKEEVILIHRYLDWLKSRPGPDATFTSPEHQRGTYRGGLTAQLQKLLPMTPDGTFDHRLASTALASPYDPDSSLRPSR